MQRIWWLVAALALACCPRGGTTPAPQADEDATMAGAVSMRLGPGRKVEHRGGFRPSRGDTVDWVRIDAEPGLVVGFAVTLSAKDGRTITLDTYGADGRLLARPNRHVEGRSQVLVIEGLPPVSQLYLRMATDDRGPHLTYTLTIREVTRAAGPDGPPPCDPEAYDAANPLCRDVCDFADPGEEDPRCCGIWQRCLESGGFCTARVMDPKFPIRLDLGRTRGLFGQRRGDPDFVPTGFLVRAGMDRVPIGLEAIHDDRSIWLIAAVRDNVRDEFIHYERAEIYPPPVCRRQPTEEIRARRSP